MWFILLLPSGLRPSCSSITHTALVVVEKHPMHSPIHRAKSEISYVFYVHDRCRTGLIHISATNPIEEILTIPPCFLHCRICHLSCNQSYRGNLNNPVVFLHCGISICHLSCNQSWMGNLNNPVVFLHCGICHLSCNQSWMGNLNNPVVFLHCGIIM